MLVNPKVIPASVRFRNRWGAGDDTSIPDRGFAVCIFFEKPISMKNPIAAKTHPIA